MNGILILVLLICVLFMVFVRILWLGLGLNQTDDDPGTQQEPWGSTDYPPERYTPLDELYRRYPPEGKDRT